MSTLEALRRQSIAALSERSDTARLDVDMLLAYALDLTDVQLITERYRKLTESQLGRCQQLFKRRYNGEPVAYITGQKAFMNLPFAVNRAVLIPRPDTEILVEALIERIAGSALCGLDVGTGSGAIAVSLLHYVEDLEMTACDISEAALSVARENAHRNGVSRRLKLVQSDLLSNVKGQFDFIVSNPPYIARREIQTLAPNVKDFEPLLALDGGVDGLDYYRAITAQAARRLAPSGKLYYEIGYDQRAAVSEILKTAGFKDVGGMVDLAGRDRVVYGTKE